MQKTREVNTLDNLSDGMLEEHGNVTLTVDIMYINKIPFIIKSPQQVIKTYHRRCFKIQHILADRQF